MAFSIVMWNIWISFRCFVSLWVIEYWWCNIWCKIAPQNCYIPWISCKASFKKWRNKLTTKTARDLTTTNIWANHIQKEVCQIIVIFRWFYSFSYSGEGVIKQRKGKADGSQRFLDLTLGFLTYEGSGPNIRNAFKWQ